VFTFAYSKRCPLWGQLWMSIAIVQLIIRRPMIFIPS
jgi:hypothetical protein